MSGHLQRGAWYRQWRLAGSPQDYREEFIPSGRKLMCRTCGSRGYQGSLGSPAPWMVGCLLGHPEQCPTCEARFVKGGLAKHLTCRSGHSACPQHNSTQHRRLLATIGA